MRGAPWDAPFLLCRDAMGVSGRLHGTGVGYSARAKVQCAWMIATSALQWVE